MTGTMCYARNSQGYWEAFCPAFDLSVQGTSFDEVSKEMNVVISDYVEACNQESPEDCKRLLNCRAPLMAIRMWSGCKLIFYCE